MPVLILLASEMHVTFLLPPATLSSIQSLPSNQHPAHCYRMKIIFMDVPSMFLFNSEKVGSGVKKAIHAILLVNVTFHVAKLEKCILMLTASEEL